MSELARRRDAREVWVSRSHLHAAMAGAVLLSGVGFGLGYQLGQSKVGAASAVVESRLVDNVPGEGLVALLAEVERGSMASATEEIVYPQLMDDGSEPALPPLAGAEVPSAQVRVAAPALHSEPVVDEPPELPYTLEVGRFDSEDEALAARDHLRGQGIDAWSSLERVDGASVYRVAVGGYALEADAEAASEAIADALRTSPVSLGAPRVAFLQPVAEVDAIELPAPVASEPSATIAEPVDEPAVAPAAEDAPPVE